MSTQENWKQELFKNRENYISKKNNVNLRKVIDYTKSTQLHITKTPKNGYKTPPGTLVTNAIRGSSDPGMVLCCSESNINNNGNCIIQNYNGDDGNSGYIRRYNITSKLNNNILQKAEIGEIYVKNKKKQGIIVYINYQEGYILYDTKLYEMIKDNRIDQEKLENVKDLFKGIYEGISYDYSEILQNSFNMIKYHNFN